MAKLPIRRTPAYIAFMDLVKRYYLDCGEPRHKYIIELASKLNELYPPKNEDFRIDVTFTAPWLSQLLNGRLESFPSPEKFRALILSLRHWAAEVETGRDRPGNTSLREWQELLRQAKNKAEQQARDGVFVDDDANDDVTDASPSDATPAAPKVRGPHHVLRAEPDYLTPGELSYLMKHGPYAQTLAVRAAKGDPQAQHQAGVLFGCDSEYHAKAFALLKSAAAAGLDPALEILDASRKRHLVEVAVEQARALAVHYRGQGEERAHDTFRSCATRASVHDDNRQEPPSS